MKNLKKLFTLIIIFYALPSYSQEMKVHKTNGTIDSYLLSQIDSITFTQQTAAQINVALTANGATATAISSGTYQGITYYPIFAIDNDSSTYWASQWDMPAWIIVEFNQAYTINKVGVWVSFHQHTISISLSQDGIIWNVVVPPTLSSYNGGAPVHNLFSIAPMSAKYIKCDITTTTAPASHIFQSLINGLEAFKQ